MATCRRLEIKALKSSSKVPKHHHPEVITAVKYSLFKSHILGVDGWVTSCVWLMHIAGMLNQSLPAPPFNSPHFLIFISLSLLTLIMALGLNERTTEVNTPRRKEVNCKWGRGEAVRVKQADKRDGEWSGCVERVALKEIDTWERRRGKEKQPENSYMRQLWSSFPYFSSFLFVALHLWINILITTKHYYTSKVICYHF